MDQSDKLNLTDYEISMLLIERNTCQYKAEQIDALLNKVGAARGFTDERKKETEPAAPAAVQEATFTTLKFEPQTGAKIGEFEVSYAPNNIPEKFNYAVNILRNSNATINSRYHGQGYKFTYWLYGSGKIYRQKLKA